MLVIPTGLMKSPDCQAGPGIEILILGQLEVVSLACMYIHLAFGDIIAFSKHAHYNKNPALAIL